MSVAPPAAAFTLEHFVGLRRVGALAVHPDGSWAAVVVERLDADRSRYVSDLWRVPLAPEPGAERAARLTRGDHRDKAPAFAPDGTLYFLSDRAPEGGKKDEDKRFQIWLLGPHGEPRQISDEPLGVNELRVAAGTLAALVPALPGVARDARRDALAARKKHGPTALQFTAMPVRFWDHWLGPTAPRLVAWDRADLPADGVLPAPRELTGDADGRALHEATWELAPDGRTVATTWATPSPHDRIDDVALALVDTTTGARRVLAEGPGLVHGAFCFAPDGAALAALRYTRRADGYGARTLWHLPLAGPARELTPGWERWPNPRTFTPDGRAVLATAEDDGRVRLFRIALDAPAPARLGPADGSWHEVAHAPDGTIVGVRSSLTHPPEVFTLAPDAATPIACARLAGLPAAAAPPVVQDRRVDVGAGRHVQTWIVEPAAAAPPERTLLWIHGGPVAAWLDQWHWRWSPFVAAAYGYRSVMPNPAGSTGFGGAWIDDVWGNTWGGRCFDDVMGVVAHLEAHDGLRARDMVAMGGSFGGYMTNWIGGMTDRFRVLVTHASVFHLATFHLSTDVPAWWELMFGATMWSDPRTVDVDRYSPSRNLARWRTPTLVLHGEKDYRVPIGEGLMLFEALQRHGVPSELVVFPDEHHWILRPRNVVAWYERVLSFIDRHWATSPAAPAAPAPTDAPA